MEPEPSFICKEGAASASSSSIGVRERPRTSANALPDEGDCQRLRLIPNGCTTLHVRTPSISEVTRTIREVSDESAT